MNLNNLPNARPGHSHLALRSALLGRCALTLTLVASVAACVAPEPSASDEVESTSSVEQALDLAAPTPPLVHPSADDLSEMLAEIAGAPADGKKTPGMIAAVIKGEHIVALGAAGFADMDGLMPMETNMVFNIGSNTKGMSALLLATLIEEHPFLTWDTTLGQALPYLQQNGVNYTGSQTLINTPLRAFVNHRSGLTCPQQGGFANNWKTKTRPVLLREFLRGPTVANNQPPSGLLAQCTVTSGNPYNYENQNFAVVQAVIELWSGKDFIDFAKNKLIVPQQVQTSFLPSQAWFLAESGSIAGTASERAYWNPFFFQPNHPLLKSGRFVTGHDENFVPVVPNDPDLEPWGLASARGGFAFTVQDWARYAIMHLRDRSEAVLKVHETPNDASANDYNYGMNHSTLTSSGLEFDVYFHDGELSGVSSRITYFPAVDMAYLFMANGGIDPTGAINQAFLEVRSQYVRSTGGCANPADKLKAVQRFWSQDMYGCAASVPFSERASLCKQGFHVCSASEFVNNNSYGGSMAEAPTHNYWTNDQLGYGGGATACFATASAQNCNADTPMRVCTEDGTDPEGNACNWEECGLGTGNTENQYFGGCNGNPTAGVLCCAN